MTTRLSVHSGQIDRSVVRQVNPVSVARIVLGIGLALLAIVMVGLVALWLLAIASGAMRSVDGFLSSLALDFNVGAVLPVVLILGILGVGAMTITGSLVAVLYNLLAEVLGGVEVTTRDRDADVAR